METDLYIKPTDKYQYLHIGSCHPKHTKSAIPYGQALRLRRMCSEETNFDKHTEALVQHFQQRDYKSEEVQSAVERAKAVERQDALQLKQKDDDASGMIPLTVTYHPNLPPLHCIRPCASRVSV